MKGFISFGLDLASDILGACHEPKAQAIVDIIGSYFG